MGTDIHCVLQKKDEKTGEYKTILYDVLSGRNYALFAFLSGVRGCNSECDDIANIGFPEGFKLDKDSLGKTHNGFYMGDHSFGYIDLKEFCEARTPAYNPGDNPAYATDETYDGIRALQGSLPMFFDLYFETYRLVFGYDS